ncbi:DUF2207 domain-containing protein [uncultured Methanobrevibacter sp.]|uniref:DUF2207 domain-containing protein n=1 Tax=uncultured Methanobrevibacter sp. TaxID=253161 RepID=UPI002607DE5C|nr:DUF2207 domain-containing protein [uncultured Methanobrevibacter sp.]
MVNKKIITIFLLLFLIISSVSCVYADDDDRSYSITQALMDIVVDTNGMLHINETFDYSFDGTYNGVYRDIPLKDGESIENIHVTADGAYTKVEQNVQDGTQHIKIYLYSDKAKTQPISDTNVKVHISYDMKNVVTVYQDTASLQYQLWGDQWDVGVDKLITTIHLPNNTDNEYWLNPTKYNESSSLNGNTITTTSNYIDSGNFYEIEVLMPESDFKNSPNAIHIDKLAKSEIEQRYHDYQENEKMWDNIGIIVGILFIISPVIPFLIYHKYGREPKVNYEGIYERELPSNDPPAVVNALIQNRDNIGTPDLKGFEATIMDLINRKIFKMKENEDKHLIIELDETHYDELTLDEKDIFNIFSTIAKDNHLDLSNIDDYLSDEHNAKWFNDKVKTWKNDVVYEHLGENKLEEFFNNKGDKIATYYTIASVIVGAVTLSMILLESSLNTTGTILGLIGSVYLIIVGVIIYLLPDDIFGQWTAEGRLYMLKWKNFKKFLKDNSLMKEHPPESIVIWNQYLVYATALGVADKVYEAMKLQINEGYLEDEYLDSYYYYGTGYYTMHSAINTGIQTANSDSDSSGFGDIGGGSGGGGGGAF